jgi:pilus assembly protein TadC
MEGWLEKGILLCVLAGVAFYWYVAVRPREEKKKREEQMEADYPEIVFKLALLIHAGLPLPQAWLRIVSEYENAERRKGKRFAYEEMILTAAQIQNGVSPAKAFGEFGRRIGLHGYMKLGNLLEQNIRKGTRGLSEMLQGEVYLALEEKSHRIRRKGEEISTKMLLPMMMMFGVVIVIILVPAFLSFSF